MNKRTGGAALGILFCATGCGQEQPPIVTARLGPQYGLIIPEQRAAAQAMSEKCHALDMAGFEALHVGQPAEAEAYARQVLALTGNDLLAPELLASALDAQGKTQEALQAYQVVVDHFDRQPRNMVPYARLLLKTGQWAQAVTAYNQTLPYLSAGQPPLANSDFSPDVPQPKELAVALHIAQGLIYSGNAGWGTCSRREEGMREFAQALQMEPDSALTNYYYGYGWKRLDPDERVRMNNAAQAKAALQKAVDLGDDTVKKAVEIARMLH